MPTLPLLLLFALAPSVPSIAADENPSVAPAAGKPGAVQQWKATDGLAYEYRVPKRYDPEVGANLTLVLHGNGLDHRWTFWNHPADEFRPDDIVVSPDGTTPHTGTGANEFLGEPADVARVRALIVELKAVWNVRQVFLYGHSQGSFFVFYFAGAEPTLVDGVVGHASGVWTWTQASKKGHHQAIGFLHGTDDHIPYGQSLGGRSFYADEQKYPRVHLRTLYDWDHRPHWHQAAQVLAWCEGVTSADPARVAASLEDLARTDRPMGVDWAALHDVATRLAGLEGATEAQRERAREVTRAVDALGAAHVEAILKGAGKKALAELTPGAWSGRLTRFLEEFRGTGAWDQLHARHGKRLEAASEAGAKARRATYEAVEKDDPAALDAATELLARGYVDPFLGEALAAAQAWLAKTEARVPKKARDRFEALAKTWREGRADGFADFVRECGKVKL